ncbi:MFS transporter, partial [Paraburkholderia strydomiana]
IFITVGVVGCITLLSGYALVTMEAFLSRFANAQDIPVVQAKMSSGYQGSLIVGPALSAFLLSSLPLNKLLLFASFSFLVCSILTALLFRIYAIPKCEIVIPTYRRSDTLLGFRTIIQSKELMTLVILTVCVNFFEGMVVSQLPAILNVEFDTKADAAGQILSAGAIVSFVALSVSGWAMKHWPLRYVGLLSIPFVLSGMIALPFARSMMTLTVAFSLWVTGRSFYTLWMRSRRIVLIPRTDAGRVLGVFLSAILAGAPLSGLFVAALGSTHRPMRILTIGLSIIVMIVGVIAMFNVAAVSEQFRRDNEESRL